MSTVAALQGRTALAHNVCRQRAKILAGKTHHAAPDGSLVAMTYHTPPKNQCYSRRSHDNGKTWGPIVKETGLRLWAPRMNRLDEDTLIITGRDIGQRATVAWFSTDNDENWGHNLILDNPQFPVSYAYTDSIGAGDGKFWVFTSSPQSAGKGDIVGVLLEVTRNPCFGSQRHEEVGWCVDRRRCRCN